MATAGFTRVAPQRVGQAGGTLNTAIAGAKRFKTALGLPDYQDILSKISGGAAGQGATIGGRYEDKQYGNTDAAREGANFARDQLLQNRAGLEAQQANIARARQGVYNPTGTEGFQNVMKLTGSALSHAQEAADTKAADAAGRRGYVGGYNPAATEQARLEAMGKSGIEASLAEREAMGSLLGQEIGLYGSERQSYGDALGAYQNLLGSIASVPTKSIASDTQANPMLDLYGRLLSGMGGDYGSIFGTALSGAKFDENRETAMMRERAQLEKTAAEEAEQRRRQAGEYDFQAGLRRAPELQASQFDLGRQQRQEQRRGYVPGRGYVG